MEFNIARRPDPETGALDLAKVGAFLEQHPETVPAVTAAMTLPIPASYTLLSYNALHTFKFVAADGTVTAARYHFVPSEGEASITDEEAAARGTSYLHDELESRLKNDPRSFISSSSSRETPIRSTIPRPSGQIATVCASATCRSPSWRSTRARWRCPRVRPDARHRWHRAQRRSDPPRAVGGLSASVARRTAR